MLGSYMIGLGLIGAVVAILCIKEVDDTTAEHDEPEHKE